MVRFDSRGAENEVMERVVGVPSRKANALSNCPDAIFGPVYSTTPIGPDPSSVLNTALFPVRSSNITTPKPYTSLFVVSTFNT
ncbi:hypothetical protein CR513_44307, partial [Mucuna pruriens]